MGRVRTFGRRMAAVFVLWPQAVEREARALTGVALRRVAVVAFKFAPAWRPA